jgi:hypothetical protein
VQAAAQTTYDVLSPAVAMHSQTCNARPSLTDKQKLVNGTAQ